MDDIIEAEVIEEPRKRAPKKLPKMDKMTVKRRRAIVVKGVLDNKSSKEICEEAGLNTKEPSRAVNQIMRHPETQILFTKVMERQGVSDDRIAQKISDLLDAKKVIYAQKDGIFTDEREVEDRECQRKTAELAARLKGHLKNDDRATTDISVGLMSVVINAIAVQEKK